MKRIVIIGANCFQRPLILKAKSLGYETHVFAWREGAVSEKDADFFYPISIIEKETILEYCYKIKPDAVLSIGSDLATITVNYLAEKLKLVGNTMESTLISTNKFEMRKALDKSGISIPRYKEYNLGEEINWGPTIKYPVIVKPVDRSGSRGVNKVENSNQIVSALKEACNESFIKKAIVEEFIEGEEFSCECITYKGEHHILAITKKHTTGKPHFIETGHMEPSGIEEKYGTLVKKEISKGLDSLGIYNGASHSEFRITKNEEIKIIEIGGRMGGDCIGSHLVQLSTGYDYIKMCLDVSFGKKPNIGSAKEQKVAAIKFIFDRNDYKKFKEIEKKFSENLYEVCIDTLERKKDVVDSSSRWGYYIMRFETKEEFKKTGLFLS